jgi:PAS domain S-box-containing protein
VECRSNILTIFIAFVLPKPHLPSPQWKSEEAYSQTRSLARKSGLLTDIPPLQITLDITAPKEAEIALTQTEEMAMIDRDHLEIERERFVALADNSKDFISMCDMDGKPFYANKSALEMVGSESLDDFNRVPIGEFFFAEDQKRVIEEFLPQALTEGFGETEIRFRHFKTNEAIWMCYQVFVIRDKAGNALGMGTVGRDLTEEKRGEAALVRSEKLAAVGRLATSIAHEINNPLAAVTNLLYLAIGHDNLPEVQDLLNQADRELRRVSKVATQTLRFHKQASKPQLLSTESLFEAVLTVYEGRLRNSNIQVERRGFEPQPVECFEGDIRQVLSNLIGNAIDAMPRGGRLMIRSRKGTEWSSGRVGLILTIADSGYGISPEVRARLFEPFFTTKGIGGTGLGLWISAEIMDRHQGRIRLRSSQAPDRCGTVVTVFLPLAGSEDLAGCSEPLSGVSA